MALKAGRHSHTFSPWEMVPRSGGSGALPSALDGAALIQPLATFSQWEKVVD